MKKIWALSSVMLAAATAMAVPYVELKNGTRKEGSSIVAKSDGTVLLTVPGLASPLTFTRDQYSVAAADKPAEMDKAMGLFREKKYDEAIAALKTIKTKYAYLMWDEQASAGIAKALLNKGDTAGAIAEYESLLRSYPRLKTDANIGWGYRNALLASKQYARLEPELKQLIATGPRPDAAKAQILRGDIKAEQNQLEPAALDYLRTVHFYEAEKEVLPEAYLKLAQTLEKMRDPRAKEWYKKTVDEFPQSPQAAAARSKM